MKEGSPKSIESQGREWADKRRTRYMSENLDVMLISKDKENFFDLPTLGNYRQESLDLPLWVPRVHPITGAVVLSRWEDYKNRSINFDKDIIFGGERKNEALRVPRMPETWKARKLIPVVVPDGIEAAMRQQDEIAHDYSEEGVETARIGEVFGLINALSENFTNGEIKSQSDVVEIAKEAEGILENHGLLFPRNEAWINVAEMIKRAADRDRLNRINPMISRIRLRSAFLELVKNEIRNPGVKDKAIKTYRWLEDERVFVRTQIENSKVALEQLIGLNKHRGFDMFENPGGKYTSRDLWEVGQLLKALSKEVLGTVQVAPYLHSVTIARKFLTGAYFENAKEERLLNERLDYVKEGPVRTEECAERYLRSGNVEGARRCIKIAHGILTTLLHDPDYQVIKRF